MSDFDPTALDPGIRELVMWMRSLGIPTTDSGDGSKADTMECAIKAPNVFAHYDDMARAMLHASVLAGYLPDRPESAIEVNWSPRDRQVILAVLGYTNEDVPRTRQLDIAPRFRSEDS